MDKKQTLETYSDDRKSYIDVVRQTLKKRGHFCHDGYDANSLADIAKALDKQISIQDLNKELLGVCKMANEYIKTRNLGLPAELLGVKLEKVIVKDEGTK